MFDDGFIFYQYILKINIKKYKMIEKLRLLLIDNGDWGLGIGDWGLGIGGGGPNPKTPTPKPKPQNPQKN
jgi:hypothetical protein